MYKFDYELLSRDLLHTKTVRMASFGGIEQRTGVPRGIVHKIMAGKVKTFTNSVAFLIRWGDLDMNNYISIEEQLKMSLLKPRIEE